jgi:HTH-type transcriptional regulator/antitoxin HigA
MPTTLTPVEAFPPGEYLRDELDVRGWTEVEFAEILGRPAQTVSEILNGRKQIVTETAIAIADALGTSAEVWVNLQTAYNLHVAKAARPVVSDVARRSALRGLVPVAELRRRRWLPDTNNVEELEASVCRLLGVEDLNSSPRFAVAARRSNAEVTFTPQQTAWLARVRLLAESKDAKSFDKAAVLELAQDLARRIHDPTDLAEIESWLRDCGIVLVTLLPLKSSLLDGAAMVRDDGTPVIGLTSRGDRLDGYVFTLLHEMAHICLGHLDTRGVTADEELDRAGPLDGFEAEANALAASWIMPEDAPLPEGRASMTSVLKVAARYGVHASFVIGRMQRQRDDWALLRRAIPRVRPFVEVET